MPLIAAVSIYVNDLDKAVTFYRDILGFAVRSRPAPFLVELEHDGTAVILCQAEEPAAGRYPASAGVVLGIATGDIAERARDLATQGVDLIHTAPRDFPGGRYIALRDPAGNAVELLEFTG
jgi:lactoylglutathione lyase